MSAPPIQVPRRWGPGLERLRAQPVLARVPAWFWRDVLLPTIVTRVALTLVGLLALSLLQPGGVVPGRDAADVVDIWSRWDGGWYRSIASDGYSFTPGRESNIAFFPLYPLLMRAVALPLGSDFGSFALAGMIVSNVALVVALAYVVALVKLDHEDDTAARTALYVLVFPTSLFLSAVYSDSLFLMFVAASFYYARMGRWWLAGVIGLAAGLTRAPGALLAIALAVEYMHQRGFDPRRIRPDALAIGLVPLGTIAYVGYLALRFGNVSVWLQAQSAWGSRLTLPWDTVTRFFSQPLALHRGEHSIIDFTFAVSLLVLVIATWRLLRPSYALLATLLFLIVVTSGSLESIGRYGNTIFPLFIVLALAGRNAVFDRAYTFGGLLLSGLFMAMFAQWYWVS
jgi:Gpi18-like mannosyltransferase